MPSSVNETQDSLWQKVLVPLQCPDKAFRFKRVKWEAQSSSEEHFQDGWRCEEVERRGTLAHWLSEAHQHYSPRPSGIVGTGGTGSLLKPLLSIFHGQREIWTLISTSPAAPCSICVGQDMCGRLLQRNNLNYFKDKKDISQFIEVFLLRMEKSALLLIINSESNTSS